MARFFVPAFYFHVLFFHQNCVSSAPPRFRGAWDTQQTILSGYHSAAIDLATLVGLVRTANDTHDDVAITYANATVNGREIGCVNCDLTAFRAWLNGDKFGESEISESGLGPKHPNAPALPSSSSLMHRKKAVTLTEHRFSEAGFTNAKPNLEHLWNQRQLILGPTAQLHMHATIIDVLTYLARESPTAPQQGARNCSENVPSCGYSAGSHDAPSAQVRVSLARMFDLSDGPQVSDSPMTVKAKLQKAVQQVKAAFAFYHKFCLPRSCDARSILLGRRRCADASDKCMYEEVRACPCADTARWFAYARLHGVLGLLRVSRERAGVLGQCEEFSRLAHALLSTMGFTAKYVFDFTDHVFLEVCTQVSVTPEECAAWVHADPSEGVVDNPLMYERDWGKNLTMLFAFTPQSIEHVTERYTKNYTATVERRGISDAELATAVNTANARLRVELPMRPWGIGFTEAVLWSHF